MSNDTFVLMQSIASNLVNDLDMDTNNTRVSFHANSLVNALDDYTTTSDMQNYISSLSYYG